MTCGGGGGTPEGPYDEIPLVYDLRLDGVTEPVHIARDEYGVAHIHAANSRDLHFALGYVMAHDRLPQMDILRRFGAGTVAELFGIDADALESDLEMRVHRMKPLAQAAYGELKASTDPDDKQLVAAVESFAAGVNAYVKDVNEGVWTIDNRLLSSFDPERFAAWDPVDSILLGRFQAFALSYTAPFVVDATDVYQQAQLVFDGASPNPDHAARAGAAADLLWFEPIDTVPTIDGFPNVGTDTGTRSDSVSTARPAPGNGPPASATGRLLSRTFGPGAAPTTADATRPQVPRELLRRARNTYRHKKSGPHGLFVPRSGSNNWVVGPEHTGGGALLAGDPHLQLPNPSIFYPVHLVIPGELDVEGSTFPGIPGVLHGHNGNVAWASTVVFHDVNDVYLEDIVPCTMATGDCVLFNGEQVRIETSKETFDVGSLGTIFESHEYTYESVPHHGHIIPTVENRQVIPRTGSQALSVRYTGQEVTHEIRFLWKLNRATNLGEAVAALEHFEYGGQNWVFIDKDDNIGWSTHSNVPVRDPNALTWDATTNPGGLAPFFVLPGKGNAEWTGYLDTRYVPHAYNPPSGYLVTANSDPVGATFDGLPLNEVTVEETGGGPLFLSSFYAPGLRTDRIDSRLQEAISNGTPITPELMGEIQTDSHSNLGDRFAPLIAAAAATLDDGTHADVTAWYTSLPNRRQNRLRDAAARLNAWSYETPPAVVGSPGQDEIDDSVATTIFNAWGHYFLGHALGDEMAAIDWDIYDLNENLTIRVALALLETPEQLASGLAAATGEPILCDHLDTAEIESCQLMALQALDIALDWIESAEGLDTDVATDWRWGLLHTLTLEPLFPDTNLNIPPPNDPDPDLRNGYPRAGDNFAVNRADCTWDDLAFEQDGAGPAQRMIAMVRDGATRIRLAIPGGTVYDPESPHFRDLMDAYYIPNAYFDVPFSTAEIVERGEERWVIRRK